MLILHHHHHQLISSFSTHLLVLPVLLLLTLVSPSGTTANAIANEHDHTNTMILSHLRDHAQLLKRNYCLTCFSIISTDDVDFEFDFRGTPVAEKRKKEGDVTSDENTDSNAGKKADLGEIVAKAHFRALLQSIAKDRYNGGVIPSEAYLPECTILVRGFLTDLLRSQASGAISYHMQHPLPQQQQQNQHPRKKAGQLDDHDRSNLHHSSSSSSPSFSASSSSSSSNILQSATWQLIKETQDDSGEEQMYSCAKEYKELFVK